MIEKLLNEIDKNVIGDPKYFYNGNQVPRVTEILSSMLHEDYLMTWANNIGLYQRQKYSEVIDKAANIGTLSHDLVEQYISFEENRIDTIKIDDYSVYKAVNNCVKSFEIWYNDVRQCCSSFNVIGMEETITCPYFGGTYDFLVEINGRNWLIDFKTSNHIGYKYALQIAAYKYMIENTKNITIDGGIILQLSKKRPEFHEYVFDFSNENEKKFIDDCLQCFFSIVYSYFWRVKIENEFKTIIGGN